MTDLIFLDTETTGLDPDIHEIWEIAYAVNDGPIVSILLPHSIITADPKALEMNGYFERHGRVQTSAWWGQDDLAIRKTLIGNTIVGANPAFDASFLRKRWGGVAPWHYQMIDVESMALGVLRYSRPKGLSAISSDLADRGYPVPMPDHSASKDVEVVREVYMALRHEAKRLSGG